MMTGTSALTAGPSLVSLKSRHHLARLPPHYRLKVGEACLVRCSQDEIVLALAQRRLGDHCLALILQAAGLKSARTICELHPEIDPWLEHKGLSTLASTGLRGES